MKNKYEKVKKENLYDYLSERGLLSICLTDLNYIKKKGIRSHEDIKLRCSRCNAEFERKIVYVVDYIEATEKKNKKVSGVYCSKCKYVKSNETFYSLYDWLQDEGTKINITLSKREDLTENELKELEKMKSEYSLKLLSLEEARFISVKSNLHTYFRCGIHNKNNDVRIRVITRKNKFKLYQLPCCRDYKKIYSEKLSYSLQDWCLLFYNYPIEITLKNKYNTTFKKFYTGKLVREFYIAGKNKILYSSISFCTKDKCNFVCKDDKNSDKKFEHILYKVSSGYKWCDATCLSCKRCNKESLYEKKLRFSDKPTMEAFLDKYDFDFLAVDEIKELYDTIEYLKERLVSVKNKEENFRKIIPVHEKYHNIEEIEKTENIIKKMQQNEIDLNRQIDDIKNDIEFKKNKYFILRNSLLGSTLAKQRQFNNKIIKFLERQHEKSEKQKKTNK